MLKTTLVNSQESSLEIAVYEIGLQGKSEAPTCIPPALLPVWISVQTPCRYFHLGLEILITGLGNFNHHNPELDSRKFSMVINLHILLCFVTHHPKSLSERDGQFIKVKNKLINGHVQYLVFALEKLMCNLNMMIEMTHNSFPFSDHVILRIGIVDI